MPASADDLTEDGILGGRLRLVQPKRGHRFGHDAILLAAAVPARAGQRVVEFGAGVGAASLALLSRVPGLQATLVEIDPELCRLARDNLSRNGFPERVLCLDAAADARAFTAAGIAAASCDHVFMNPPFNDPSQQPSPDPRRRSAHVATADVLPAWTRAARGLLKEGGTLTLIWRASGLPGALQAMQDGFGGLSLMPVYPAPREPAIRVILSAAKASRAPLRVLPPLTLADDGRRPTAEAEAILRHGGAWPPAP